MVHTINVTLLCILASLVGVSIHTLMAYDSNRKMAKAGNVKFDLSEFWENDKITILLAFLSVFAWYLIFGEISKKVEWLSEFVICSFLVFGMFGSYIIQYGFGKSKGIIRKAIDSKTNQLESILNNKNEKTMEEFVIIYESNTDMVKGHDGLSISIDQYAANSGGQNNSSVKEIVYDNTTVDVTFVRNDTSTYVVVPIRRPK